MGALVETETDDAVAVVRFNRPEKLNALTAEVLGALRDALEELHANPTRPMLLAGAGRATCAGMDVDLVSQPDYRERHPEIRELHHDTRRLVAEYPLPTAMAGTGAVIGAAFVLALKCDFLVLGDETHFSLPEIQYDLSAPSTADLTRLVGPRIAKEIQLTGDPVPPERARAHGLANEVVPEEEVEDATRGLLSRIAEHDDDAVRETLAEHRDGG